MSLLFVAPLLLLAAGPVAEVAGPPTLVEAAIALLALTTMEIVLGIDNIVFIAILTGKLPESQRAAARNVGLGLAMGMRLLLLLSINWIMQLDTPIVKLEWFGVAGEWLRAAEHREVNEISWRDVILLVGGLFLTAKAVLEIHHKIEGAGEHQEAKATSFGTVIAQILALDLVFSLDSVITAVGMVRKELLWVMIVSIVAAVGVMLAFAGPVSRFIEKHPTLKMLALSFLLLIGMMLVAEGVGTHIDKGYIYFAMAFALLVECLNLWVRIRLHRAKAPTTHQPTPL